MNPGFLAPRGALDSKPPHGQPCNNCGLCCIATLCPLGKKIFRHEMGPCPALKRDSQNKSYCGVVADPMRYAMALTLRGGVEGMKQAAALLIGANTGCDARFNGEPPDQSFYDRLKKWDYDNRDKIRNAKRMWNVK